jgi:hypothetical protein
MGLSVPVGGWVVPPYTGRSDTSWVLSVQITSPESAEGRGMLRFERSNREPVRVILTSAGILANHRCRRKYEGRPASRDLAPRAVDGVLPPFTVTRDITRNAVG